MNIFQQFKKPLVVIYGPPGVGKLTVAKELSKKTKLSLFHNHLSSDLVSLVFGKLENQDLIDKIRLDFFEFAAKNNLGLVFTFVYAHQNDDNFMDELVQIAQKFQTKIYFIQLLCDEKVWKNRIKSQERKNYKKVRDFILVQETMQNYDLLTPYSKAKNHQTLNISNLKPQETTKNIIQFLIKP
jgi:predicted kinase